MKTETFDDPQAFMQALTGKKRPKAKDARPGLPRASAGEGDRIAQLMRIAKFGYGPRWDDGVGYSFWQPSTGAMTTAHQDYAAACVAAEGEVKG